MIVPGDIVTIDMWKVSWRSYYDVKQGLYLVTHVYKENYVPHVRLLELPDDAFFLTDVTKINQEKL